MSPLFDLEEFTGVPQPEDPFPPGYFKNKPRPGKDHDDIKRLVVEDLLPRVVEWCQEEPDEDELREQLLEVVEPHQDGFQMAKELDREGWDADSALVDVLNDADFYGIHQKAVKAWIRDNATVPKLALGAEVTICKWSSGKPNLPGVIVKIREEDGTYIVDCPKEGHDVKGTCGFVKPWEEVEAQNLAA